MMRRRQFIAGLGSVVVCPVAVRAQQPAIPVIGYLSTLTRTVDAINRDAFQKGLNEMGYVEAQNVAMAYRWAENRNDRLPALAAELVQQRVAVIAAMAGQAAARAAKAATTAIPIVFQIGADPVLAGLVTSLNRPGGNVTGVTNINPEITSKRLQLLCELVPSAAVIGWMFGPLDVVPPAREAEAAGRVLGRQIVIVTATNEKEIDLGIDALARQGVKALLVSANPFLNGRREQISGLAARHAIATGSEFAEDVSVGGLMSYGSSLKDQCRQVGVYVGRILKGEKPTDLPVLQPTKFELVINLKTAKALGLTIPETLLATADEVIQ
jgi:putative ABC transport system substrate-binding protein